uniref:Late embryogenesis abundant protein LEA-2 subgroup domain-containing protein n=1 Tax=Fagus sylvatica TaxID=28930 RepID=A0A2N9GL17_FAGSY
MAEKTNQQVNPLAPSAKHPRSDEESASSQSKELKRKKRIKWAIYIAVFAVFQTIVITVFALTVMRVKTPKVRLGSTDSVTFHNFTTGNQTSPSFNISFTTQVRVKNTNFGPYKYDSTNATFMYQGVTVGQVTIPKGKAGLCSTKKVSVTVVVDSKALPSKKNLESDMDGGLLMLGSHVKLSGKVELLFVMKKKKATEMNCTMTINLSAEKVQSIICE